MPHRRGDGHTFSSNYDIATRTCLHTDREPAQIPKMAEVLCTKQPSPPCSESDNKGQITVECHGDFLCHLELVLFQVYGMPNVLVYTATCS